MDGSRCCYSNRYRRRDAKWIVNRCSLYAQILASCSLRVVLYCYKLLAFLHLLQYLMCGESQIPLEAHLVFLRMRCFGLSSDLMVSSCQLLSNSVHQCETTLLSLFYHFWVLL